MTICTCTETRLCDRCRDQRDGIARFYGHTVFDTDPHQAVDSSSSLQHAAFFQEKTFMTLTLKGLSKNGKSAYYTGASQNLRFPIGAFPDKTAPATI